MINFSPVQEKSVDVPSATLFFHVCFLNVTVSSFQIESVVAVNQFYLSVILLPVPCFVVSVVLVSPRI